MRKTNQAGYIMRHRGWWVLRYRERVGGRENQVGPKSQTTCACRCRAQDKGKRSGPRQARTRTPEPKRGGAAQRHQTE